jgi:hypothetical protein
MAMQMLIWYFVNLKALNAISLTKFFSPLASLRSRQNLELIRL